MDPKTFDPHHPVVLVHDAGTHEPAGQYNLAKARIQHGDDGSVMFVWRWHELSEEVFFVMATEMINTIIRKGVRTFMSQRARNN